MRVVNWGISLPHVGRQASRDAVADFAQHADASSTDDGSFAQPSATPFVDPIGTLFFVAGTTSIGAH